MKKLTKYLALSVAVLFLLAGCGKKPAHPVAPTTPPESGTPVPAPNQSASSGSSASVEGAQPNPGNANQAAAAVDAVKQYFHALGNKEFQTAYGLMSRRFRQSVGVPDDLAGNSIMAVRSMDVTVDTVGPLEAYLTVTVNLELRPNAAVAWDSGTNTRFAHMVYEDGGWKVDALATSPRVAEGTAIPAPSAVVKQYYAFAEKGDWASAWTLIHPTERVGIGGQSAGALKEQFMAQQPGPRLVTATDGNTLDQYKFYSTQLTQLNVATVNAAFADGSTRTLHLSRDEMNQWRLYWVSGPDGSSKLE